jgi:hypothetical protein
MGKTGAVELGWAPNRRRRKREVMGDRLRWVFFFFLEGGYLLSWDKIVICIRRYHEAGEACHNGSCLDVEVAQHFVRAPPSEQLDGVSVDVGT